MDSTSVSLLRRLNEPEHDAAAELSVELYARLIFGVLGDVLSRF